MKQKYHIITIALGYWTMTNLSDFPKGYIYDGAQMETEEYQKL